MARVTIAVVAVVAALAIVGGLLVIYDDRSGPPIVIEDPLVDATIVVSVEGAVATPGVYALPAGARVQDALDAAGGPTGDADLAGFNPARRVGDEELVVVPRVSPPAAPEPGADRAIAAPATEDESPLLDLNTASLAELDELPGIGPVLAQRIIDHRTAIGRFRAIEELAEVDGISARMVDELRPLLTVQP